MKVLQTIKYYEPSKGGMESVAKNIVDGVIASTTDFQFTIYANSHKPLFKRTDVLKGRVQSIKEFTPFIIKSQPLSLSYPILSNLISDADIVHHHYPFPNMEIALLKNKQLLKNKKFIITWHANINNSRWSWISKFYNPIIQQLLDLATYIVVTSPQLADSSEILPFYKDKVRVIPLSFDPAISMSHLAPRLFPDERRFKLLFVGKLRAYKGLSYLLDAVQGLEVDLTIVGNGEDRDTLIKKTKLLNMDERVSFKMDLSDKEVSEIYQNSDLFILPSINEAEAFGVVQLEAMANGLPVINTNLASGVPFVSLNGVTGLTVEPRSTEKLRAAIQKLIGDRDLYEKFSRNAIARSKEFGRDQMTLSYLKLYQS